MIALIPLLAAANVALYVEEVRGVSTASTAAVLDALEPVIEARTGGRVTRDASDWVDCGGKARRACIDELVAKNHGGDVIMLVLVGGITKLRVLAERIAPDGRRIESTIDLSKGSVDWSRLVAALFPDAGAGDPDLVSPPAVVSNASARSHLPSWIAIGVSATAGTLAIVFQAKSARAQDALSSGVHAPAELDALIDERRGAQTASAALLIAAGVSAAAAIVFEAL